jgi:hypothetical protein
MLNSEVPESVVPTFGNGPFYQLPAFSGMADQKWLNEEEVDLQRRGSAIYRIP